MDEGFNLIHNTFDKVLIILISWFFSVSFLTWFLVNIVKTNNYFVWILAIPLGLIISVILVNQYKFNFKVVEKKNIFSQILFIFLLVLVVFYYLEPIISYPMSTIGIPNKDLHDGISVFIADHGYAPIDSIEFAKNFYILSSQKGLYLGYPNLLHSFSALLIKLGGGIFYATWIAIVIGLVVNSIALFILLRFIYKDNNFIAILSGLFAISSYRIPITAIVSIPMMFSLLLILPSLLVFILAVNSGNKLFARIMPILALSLLAISYGGTIVLFFGILFLMSLILITNGKTNSVRSLLTTIIFSIPLLIFCLTFQKNIYWENTFPTIKDYDPYELSQRLIPIDIPVYMFFLITSFGFFVAENFKEKIPKNEILYKIFFFFLTIIFFSPILYYFVFHIVNNVPNTEALAKINPSGIFGGLNFQKISRLALFEPYIFIFFLGYVAYLFKKPWRYILITIIVLLNFIIRQNFFVYQVISPEVKNSFYNQKKEFKIYTLLSDLRLIINPQVWSKDIFGALNWLKVHKNENNVLLWDERQWTEETIAGWGSIYIREKIFRPSEYDIKELTLNYQNLSLINNTKLYLLMINPSEKNLLKIQTIPGSIKSYSQGRVFIYKLK